MQLKDIETETYRKAVRTQDVRCIAQALNKELVVGVCMLRGRSSAVRLLSQPELER